MQALKALVIIMGIMIIVGVAVIAVTIYNRLSNPAGEVAPAILAPDARPAGFGDAVLPIPAGCRVASASATGERLILQLESMTADDGACAQILVLDMGTGSLLGRFVLTPDAAPAE